MISRQPKNAESSNGLRRRKPSVSDQIPDTSDNKTSTADKHPSQAADQLSSVSDSTEEEDALDQHVKDVLKKSKKEWLKRTLKGVWAFLKTPIGIITGIYGFLVVFWGAALVIFLLGKYLVLNTDHVPIGYLATQDGFHSAATTSKIFGSVSTDLRRLPLDNR